MNPQSQKSILSYFQKTAPENRSSGSRRASGPSVQQANRNVTAVFNPPPSADDVRGTDTPPEKVPRQVLPASFATNANNSSGSSLFESIMHKFVKVDDSERVSHKYASLKFSLFCFSFVLRSLNRYLRVFVHGNA